MQFSLRVMLPAALAVVLCAAGCAPENAKIVKSYRMGDRVEMGKLVYNVYDSQWHTQFGEGASARVPQHRFFLVRLSVSNNGSADVLAPSLTVTDAAGKDYPELSDGSQVPQWAGYLRNIKPGQTVQGNAVFDCPPGNYKVRIAEDNDQTAAVVDVPLTLASETPDVPSPEIPEKGEKK